MINKKLMIGVLIVISAGGMHNVWAMDELLAKLELTDSYAKMKTDRDSFETDLQNAIAKFKSQIRTLQEEKEVQQAKNVELEDSVQKLNMQNAGLTESGKKDIGDVKRVLAELLSAQAEDYVSWTQRLSAE